MEKDRVLLGVQRILDKVLDAAGELGVVLPARQVVAAAAVPFDCEQVVVYATTVRTGGTETRSGAGTYPNDGSNVILYRVTVTVVIVRATATLPTVPASGVAQSVPPPASYLTNLTSASSDTAVLVEAADRAQTEDGQVGTGAVPRQVTYSNPQGGLFATSCSIEVVI